MKAPEMFLNVKALAWFAGIGTSNVSIKKEDHIFVNIEQAQLNTYRKEL
jgi:hypothetical protein